VRERERDRERKRDRKGESSIGVWVESVKQESVNLFAFCFVHDALRQERGTETERERDKVKARYLCA